MHAHLYVQPHVCTALRPRHTRADREKEGPEVKNLPRYKNVNKQLLSERVVAASRSAGGSSFPSSFPGNFQNAAAVRDGVMSIPRLSWRHRAKISITRFPADFPPGYTHILLSLSFPQLPEKPHLFLQDGCKDPLTRVREWEEAPASQEHPASGLHGNGKPISFWPG